MMQNKKANRSKKGRKGGGRGGADEVDDDDGELLYHTSANAETQPVAHSP
jgi:hypothetical protein